MKKTLIISNNYCYLDKIIDDYDVVIFRKAAHSAIQEDFFRDRYQFIKARHPKVQSSKDTPHAADFLGWNSANESIEFKKNILPHQNRLFSSLDFSIPEGFSSFKKKAERALPKIFEAAIWPYDSEVTQRLEYFFDKKKLASNYFNSRNGLVGHDYSTQLSPFLSCGALDVRHLYNCIKRYEEVNGANKSTYWLVFELLWREYFYWHYQKHQTHYFSQNGLKGPKSFSSIKNYEIDELRNLSSSDFFLASLNELENTGFLSNRVRQIFASVWINDLELPWLSGALLFERYLIDYDVYSNYGNWMYLAGVGVDPRGKRYFNVQKQLAQYDPLGEYISKWLEPHFRS